MAASRTDGPPTFRVLDAFDAPHGGRILRLRLQSGEAPPVQALRGAEMKAVSPDGPQRTFTIDGFALFGGKPSDDRLARTGRIDVHVSEAGDPPGPPISARWEVLGPLS